MRKVKILGTRYLIKKDNEMPDKDGLFLEYDKLILIKDKKHLLSCEDDKKHKGKRQKEVLRHEIIHAYFSESGLECYCSDETLVDYLAMQLPKIFETCEELNIL